MSASNPTSDVAGAPATLSRILTLLLAGSCGLIVAASGIGIVLPILPLLACATERSGRRSGA